MKPKPQSLQIRADNNRLVGTDTDGNDWNIRWCGNGSISHWVLYQGTDMGKGFYVYIFDKDNPLKKQIEEAETKYGVYL